MRLKTVHVRNYRSIVDSDPVEISERVTVVIGKNEQGKTTFLKALTSFNQRNKYSPNDLPNHLRAVLEEKKPAEIPIISLRLEPEKEDRELLVEAVPAIANVTEFEVTKFYDGHYTYNFKDANGRSPAVQFAPPNIGDLVSQVKKSLDALKASLVEHATRYPTFAPSKPQADAHIDQLATAKFSDPATLDNIFATFLTALKGLPGQDGAIQQEIAATEATLLKAKAQILENLKKDPVRVFHQAVPYFVFHSTLLDKIPNEVSVADFVRDPEAISKGMSNLCKVAGLSTQKIQELAAATDVGRREAYEDHYRSSISGGINEFWTQETYNVHFRIDRDKLSVTISDNTYNRRISPSERSDGFQWYLSFYTALLSEVSATTPAVVLLDNPGLELHADGQRDIKRFLEERLPAIVQVIYVTHSPAMIDTFNLEQVRHVELRPEMQGTKIKKLSFEGGRHTDLLEPVRSAIGASLITTLFSNEFNILVEGAADKPILEGAFTLLQGVDQARIAINGSISETGRLLPQFFQRSGLPFLVYLDADSRGRELKRSLEEVRIPADRIAILSEVFERQNDFEIEDILTADFYAQAVTDTYPANPVPRPEEGEGKRTRAYEIAYRNAHGIGFSKRRVGDTVKRLILAGRADEHSRRDLGRLAEVLWQKLEAQAAPRRA